MTFHLKDLAGLVMDEDDPKPQVQVVTVSPTVKTNVGVLQPSSITGTVDADHQDDVYQRLAAKTVNLIQQVADMDDLNTVIVVTHDVTAACAVADHIWMLGRDHDVNGALIDGAYIVKSYNLIDLDLAWHPNIITQPNFMSFVAQIKREFKAL